MTRPGQTFVPVFSRWLVRALGVLAALAAPGASLAAPFDPLQYGTVGGPSAALAAYTPSGINGGGGPYFTTGWTATRFNGNSGRDLFWPAPPALPPVKSLVGGPHCSFNQIYGGANPYFQASGGTLGVDPAGCVVAGVFDAAHGLDPLNRPMTIFEVGYGNLSLRISPDRFLVVAGDLGSFTTNIRPSAGPMAFVIWSSANEVRIACSSHATAVSAAPVASSLSPTSDTARRLLVGCDSGGLLAFRGGIRSLYFWNTGLAGFGAWTPAQVDAACADLAAASGIVPPTELLIFAGDSYGAGFKLFGGESAAQWLAADVPTRRIINLAQAGAVASDPTHALPDVLHDQLPRILDPRNIEGFTPITKTVIVFDGHNEILTQKPPTADYIATKVAYTDALNAAGFRVVWSDINPITNRYDIDSLVTDIENRRRSYRAAIAVASGNALRLTYCDSVPTLNTGTGAPDEVRLVTRGECYYNPMELRPSGQESWVVGTWSDEIHMGAIGWNRIRPYLAAAAAFQQPVGSCCNAINCMVRPPAACTAPGEVFRLAGESCQPNPCAGMCCDMATMTCTLVAAGQCSFPGWAPGSACSATPCEAGACCIGTTCVLRLPTLCDPAAFHGVGVTCNPANPVLCCRANIDHLHGVDIQDIFEFLNAWFAGTPVGDFDESGRTEVQDVFVFLNAWFAGCN